MRKLVWIFWATILCAVLFAGCSSSDKTTRTASAPVEKEQQSVKIPHVPLSQELLDSRTLIVDIRTAEEWQETGVFPGTLLLTFFDKDGNYDAEAFLAELNRHRSGHDRVAILCRSGNRSFKLSRYLVTRGFPAIIDIYGGVKAALKSGLKTVPWTPTVATATSGSAG